MKTIARTPQKMLWKKQHKRSILEKEACQASQSGEAHQF
jgi:hypothetical protein